jgi:hypothetical protein
LKRRVADRAAPIEHQLKSKDMPTAAERSD